MIFVSLSYMIRRVILRMISIVLPSSGSGSATGSACLALRIAYRLLRISHHIHRCLVSLPPSLLSAPPRVSVLRWSTLLQWQLSGGVLCSSGAQQSTAVTRAYRVPLTVDCRSALGGLRPPLPLSAVRPPASRRGRRTLSRTAATVTAPAARTQCRPAGDCALCVRC
jgi:hypothetical protein